MEVLPKNRPAAIASLDGTVQIVPLVDPADRRVGRLPLVQGVDWFSQADSPQKSEDTVQHAAIVRGRDNGVSSGVRPNRLQPIPVRLNVSAEMQSRSALAKVRQRT